LHRFEQSGLRARRGAIDFVGENDLRHERTRAIFKLLRLLIIHRQPGDIAGQQIGRELNPAKRATERTRERFGERRLADTWDIFKEDVPFAQERDEREIDDLAFADDDLANIGANRGGGRLNIVDGCSHCTSRVDG